MARKRRQESPGDYMVQLFTFDEKKLPWDFIGDWSLVKLEILQKYAAAYSTVLAAQRNPDFHHTYIDGFAGGGAHVAKSTGAIVAGSAVNALEVRPPFCEYHFIDLDAAKTDSLKEISTPIGEQLPDNVFIYTGDCNEVLLRDILPTIHYRLRHRRWRIVPAGSADGPGLGERDFPTMSSG